MVDGVPHEVSEEKEEQFLEDKKDSNPTLKYAKGDDNTYIDLDTGEVKKDLFSGNQKSSTEDATAGQNTPASNSVSKSDDGSSESQNQKLDTETQGTYDPLMGVVHAPDSKTKDYSQIAEDYSIVDANIKSANKIIDNDTDGDGRTDLQEISSNSVDQFYEDLLYNDIDAPKAKQDLINNKAQENLQSISDNTRYINPNLINSPINNINTSSIENKKPLEVNKDINKVVQLKHDEAIQELALQDYIKAQDDNFSLKGLSREQRAKKIEERYKNPAFKKILEKVKKESKVMRTKRAELNRKLASGEIDQEGYNKEINKLNGYKDKDGKIHEPEDRIHNHFLDKVVEQNEDDVLRQSIKDQHKEATKDMSNKERKEYKEKLEDEANIKLDNVRKEIEGKINEIKTADQNLENIDVQIGDYANWFNSEEENGGKWILNEIEKIKNRDFKGNQNIIDEIDRIKNGTYYTEEELDTANKKIQSLAKEYEAQLKADVDAAQQEITNLASVYKSKEKEVGDLKKTFDDTISLRGKLDDEFNKLDTNKDELALYAKEARKSKKGLSGLKIGGEFLRWGKGLGDLINMSQDTKVELLNKIDSDFIRNAVDVASTGLLGPIGIIADNVFRDRLTNKETGEKESLWDKFDDKYDEWRYEKIDSRIMDRPEFDELWHDNGKFNWTNFGDWAGHMAAEQVPIMAAIMASGGLAGLGVIAASATGMKYEELQDERDMYSKTGGLYGMDHKFPNMVLNATISGISEGAFEYATAGILGRTVSAFTKGGFREASKLGFKNFVQKGIFTPKNMLALGGEWLEEGFSESLTTISQNMADKYISGKDVQITDNVGESFFSGLVMAKGMTSLRLGPALMAPFRTTDTNQEIGEIANKMRDVTKKITELKNLNDPKNSLKIRRLEEQYAMLVDKSTRLAEYDAKRVDVLHPSEKKALVEIERRNFEDRKEAERVASDIRINKQERAKRLKELQGNVDSRNSRKDQILNKVEPNVVNENYKRTMDWINGYVDKVNKMGPTQVNSREVSGSQFQYMNMEDISMKSRQDVESAMALNESYIEGLKSIANDKRVKKETRADAKEQINIANQNLNHLNNVMYSKNEYGMMIPRVENGKLKSMDIVINRDAALKDGEFHVGAHEFVHAAIRNTLHGDTHLRGLMGNQVDKIVNGNGVVWRNDTAKKRYEAKLREYDESQAGEEKLAFVGEMLISGDINFKDGPLTKFKGLLRRFSHNVLGHPIKFDTTEDVKNFLRDYKHSYDNKTISPAIAELLARGANGKLFKDGRSSQERSDQASFSRAVDLNRRQNVDLKREFDQYVQNSDGTKKYENHEMFKDSPDFHGAYLNIVEGRALDGLVQHGMTEKGLPPEALREFTRSAKEEVGRRFIENYDYNKNDSLFGWLTGVSGGAGRSIIYRAKGDVMKQYVKDQKAQQRSLDKPIGESGTIADIIQDEKDTLIEQLENADMTPSVKRDVIGEINNLKYVKEMLGLPDDVKLSMMDAVQTSNIPLEDLTYKGVKDLLVSTDGKATSEKKVTPTGPLFGVLNAISTEFGIDPLRILAKQDLNAEQRLLAQEYIFDKTINEDGSFNKMLLDILPEGETRSGEATGVANTKLGQLYKTGPRLKVAEGASKSLGQKKAQIKRKNINSKEFLEIFGINSDGSFVPGTKADGAIRALVVQVAQMAANQDIRINAAKNNLINANRIARIGEGKSEKMFHKHIRNSFELMPKDYRKGLITKIPRVLVQHSGDIEKTDDKKVRQGAKLRPDLDGRLNKNETVQQGRDRIGNKFVTMFPEFRQMIKSTMSGGVKLSLFLTNPEFDMAVPDAGAVQRFISRFKYSVKDKALGVPVLNKTFLKRLDPKENKQRIKLLYDFSKAMETYLNKNPKDDWFFDEMISDSVNNQGGAFSRILSPFTFYLVNENGNPVYNKKIEEEHCLVQKKMGNSLVNHAKAGEIDKVFPVIQASYMQGALSKVHDDMVTKAGFKTKMPDFFYDVIIPRINNKELDWLDDGLASIVRYTLSNVPLNSYKLLNGQRVTEYFNVYVPNASPEVVKIQNDLINKQLSGEIAREDVPAELEARVKEANIKAVKDSERLVIIETNAEKSKPIKKPRGASIFDFDETLIIKGKNFVVATNPQTGEVENISSGDWPTRGTELMEQGWDFNFDDFVNVRGGIEGPLFQKLLNRIKKYGSKNNFILTARPQEAAVAIHGWLKSKGVNFPIENITGLADSTGDSKAQWILNKYKEGYNDMYFVDDAMQNVDAVKHVMNQLDIKGSSVQARISRIEGSDISKSKNISQEFNEMLENTSSVKADKIVSIQEAKRMGQTKGNYQFFVPPSAEDFKGLIYRFLGKGKRGDADLKWFKENLFDPFAKGIRAYNEYRQNMSSDYTNLRATFPGVTKNLESLVPGTKFRIDDAVRVYLWNKNGFEIPGVTDSIIKKLVSHVESNPNIKSFADSLSRITKLPEGYMEPSDYWAVESIASNLNKISSEIGRADFLKEWKENRDIVFSSDNLNKIEAIYGTTVRDALENILYRMETGRNRVPSKDKTVRWWLDWINGSVGAVMFFNMRSALLQTISTVNFINWEDNNMFKAAAAFANQPQYWKDFSFIFNSDMLKQRRAGLQIDVHYNEITEAFKSGKSKPQAVIHYLLEKGFLPTQIADSFAIAAGGATFYRNRLNKYIKEGMNKDQAKNQAWLDFQEIAEETQQSSRPDLISAQQAGTLGRIILAWQNTPMQMTRLTKKAMQDLVSGRGNWKSNVSRIMYYGLVQNLIFGALQSGLAFLMFGNDHDEEDEKRKVKRVLNGALDTLLRGTGVYGALVSTLKNTILKYQEQEDKKWGSDHAYTIIEGLNLSPPIGAKLRKIYNAIQTKRFNEGVGEKLKYRIENPSLSIAGNLVEALTNFPLARLVNKANNIEEALTGNHEMWQRVALLGGWNRWSIGVEDEELEAAKQEVKDEKKEKKKIEKEKKKEEEKKQKEIEEQKEKERKEKEGIKTVRCSGTNSAGKRCGMTTETKAKSWKCIHHAAFEDGMDRDNDGIKEYQCTATTSSGKRCRNKTENKNKKCYAHQ